MPAEWRALIRTAMSSAVCQFAADLSHAARVRVSASLPWRMLRRVPAWLLLGGALAPVVMWYARRLDDGSDEPLGLLVLLGTVALAWRERHGFHASGRARFGGALLALASVLAIGWLPPMLRAAVALAGVVLWCGMRRHAGLIGLLALSLPVVASLQFYLGYPLRLGSAAGAAWLLEAGGVVVARTGVELELAGQTVGVDPACSGVRMLWHAWAGCMVLAAVHRVGWRMAGAGLVLATAGIIPVNSVRAAWLAVVETGRIGDGGLGHGGIGMLCFAGLIGPLAWLMARHARAAKVAMPSARPRYADRLALLAAAALAPVMQARTVMPPEAAPASPPPQVFTFNGLALPLAPLAATPAEQAFAASFPGSLHSFRWGDAQVVLRRVTTATRRLHSSRDCLRAAGFGAGDATVVRTADGTEWSRFAATRGGTRLLVHERIVSERDGRSWTDVSAWFWSALSHPLNGPWRAETVIDG
jgi:exosortase/archaeosortase family protein